MTAQTLNGVYVDPTTGIIAHRCGTQMCLTRANDTVPPTSVSMFPTNTAAVPFYEPITGATLSGDGASIVVNVPPQVPGQYTQHLSVPAFFGFAYDAVRHFKQTSLV